MKRIFAINLGSTSTKVAYCVDGEFVLRDTIAHDAGEFAGCATVFDQKDLREQAILAYMAAHGIGLDELDALVTRGGQTEPIEGGVWQVNDAMVEQAMGGEWGVHVCSVGSAIALDLCRGRGALPLTVDTPSTDELSTLARYSGLPDIPRRASFQALNHRAMARHYAEEVGRPYGELNLVTVMLGGGITVVAHERGRMADAPDGLEGEGPFSNNRCGTVPVGEVIKMCFDSGRTRAQMMRHINGEAGLVAYLGTTDIRAICAAIEQGDARSAEVIDAMCYQTAKEVGALATALKGDVDAILLVGGMANASYIVERIRERVAWIAPVVVMPGEREMESLCLSSLAALRGEVPIQQFVPKESR